MEADALKFRRSENKSSIARELRTELESIA